MLQQIQVSAHIWAVVVEGHVFVGANSETLAVADGGHDIVSETSL